MARALGARVFAPITAGRASTGIRKRVDLPARGPRAGNAVDRGKTEPKRALVVGGSSGIGRALAGALADEGYRVGIVARRTDLLLELRRDIGGEAVVRTVDVARPDHAMAGVWQVIEELGGIDLFIVSAGVGFRNPDLDWTPERDTISINALGFAAMANVAVAHFEARGGGHLVGISSVAALGGSGVAPAYAASKAFVSSYLKGIRYRFMNRGLPIDVTDVRPGFVDTQMAGGTFWVASPDVVALQVVDAIRRRRKVVYVTRRWRLIAWAIRLLPATLLARL